MQRTYCAVAAASCLCHVPALCHASAECIALATRPGAWFGERLPHFASHTRAGGISKSLLIYRSISRHSFVSVRPSVPTLWWVQPHFCTAATCFYIFNNFFFLPSSLPTLFFLLPKGGVRLQIRRETVENRGGTSRGGPYRDDEGPNYADSVYVGGGRGARCTGGSAAQYRPGTATNTRKWRWQPHAFGGENAHGAVRLQCCRILAGRSKGVCRCTHVL